MVCQTSNYEPSVNHRTDHNIGDNILKNERQIRGILLNGKQMEFLKNKPYMYNCFVSSILENLLFQKFWYFLSRFVPAKVAPCTLTCVGLIINVVTCAILMWYSPNATQMVPNWTFMVCAVGIFIYQILDALDGKQAIKVQDTPIEEVYDHGCDAISALFVTQSVAIATRLGNYPFMQFIFFLLPMIAFFMTHFSCHVTRVMVFGRIDVIEGQWAMISVHILTYIYGQQIWETTLFSNLTVTHMLFALTVSALIQSIVSNFCLILGKDSPMDKYIRIPRKSGGTEWSPLYSLVILSILTLVSYKQNIFQTNPIVCIFMFGLSFAKLTFKIQIMNVSHGNMPKLDTSAIGPLLLVANSYLNLFSIKTSLLLSLLFALTDHCLYFAIISFDMKRALDLNIFSLKYPVGHQKCRNKNYGFNLNGTENEHAITNIKKYSGLLKLVYEK